jgi:hypothetical protein
MTTYRVEFILPGLPKMKNLKRTMGHWAQAHREASKWKRMVKSYLNNKRPAKPLEKAKLTLTRGSSVEPDFDGLVSGFYHVIDGLVEANILVNDKPSNIGSPTYLWEKAAQGKGFVKIIVEEIVGG